VARSRPIKALKKLVGDWAESPNTNRPREGKEREVEGNHGAEGSRQESVRLVRGEFALGIVGGEGAGEFGLVRKNVTRGADWGGDVRGEVFFFLHGLGDGREQRTTDCVG
jgi:hypothetical protein